MVRTGNSPMFNICLYWISSEVEMKRIRTISQRYITYYPNGIYTVISYVICVATNILVTHRYLFNINITTIPRCYYTSTSTTLFINVIHYVHVEVLLHPVVILPHLFFAVPRCSSVFLMTCIPQHSLVFVTNPQHLSIVINCIKLTRIITHTLSNCQLHQHMHYYYINTYT